MSDQDGTTAYVGRLIDALESISAESVHELVTLLHEVRHAGTQVMIIGNGGSASTASHMAVDLGVGSDMLTPGLRTVSLVDNAAMTTATANDRSFEEVFSRQVRLIGRPGDVLIAISASGNSPNLLHAITEAKDSGIRTVGLTAFDGGAMKRAVDLSIHVETALGDYGPAEDAHLAINHMVAYELRGGDFACAEPTTTRPST